MKKVVVAIILVHILILLSVQYFQIDDSGPLDYIAPTGFFLVNNSSVINSTMHVFGFHGNVTLTFPDGPDGKVNTTTLGFEENYTGDLDDKGDQDVFATVNFTEHRFGLFFTTANTGIQYSTDDTYYLDLDNDNSTGFSTYPVGGAFGWDMRIHFLSSNSFIINPTNPTLQCYNGITNTWKDITTASKTPLIGSCATANLTWNNFTLSDLELAFDYDIRPEIIPMAKESANEAESFVLFDLVNNKPSATGSLENTTFPGFSNETEDMFQHNDSIADNPDGSNTSSTSETTAYGDDMDSSTELDLYAMVEIEKNRLQVYLGTTFEEVETYYFDMDDDNSTGDNITIPDNKFGLDMRLVSGDNDTNVTHFDCFNFTGTGNWEPAIEQQTIGGTTFFFCNSYNTTYLIDNNAGSVEFWIDYSTRLRNPTVYSLPRHQYVYLDHIAKIKSVAGSSNTGGSSSGGNSGGSGGGSGSTNPDDDTIFALGEGSVILYKYVNGNLVSTISDMEGVSELDDITFAGKNHLFAGGPLGIILVSFDNGATWASQTTPGPENIKSISCSDDNTCFAVGNGLGVSTQPTRWKTEDGGGLWIADGIMTGLLGSDFTDVVSCGFEQALGVGTPAIGEYDSSFSSYPKFVFINTLSCK